MFVWWMWAGYGIKEKEVFHSYSTIFSFLTMKYNSLLTGLGYCVNWICFAMRSNHLELKLCAYICTIAKPRPCMYIQRQTDNDMRNWAQFTKKRRRARWCDCNGRRVVVHPDQDSAMLFLIRSRRKKDSIPGMNMGVFNRTMVIALVARWIRIKLNAVVGNNTI